MFNSFPFPTITFWLLAHRKKGEWQYYLIETIDELHAVVSQQCNNCEAQRRARQLDDSQVHGVLKNKKWLFDFLLWP